MKATKETVAKAAAISSNITAIANNNSDFPDHANKEKSKFIAKFGSLNSERATYAKSQSINKEILSNTSNI